MQKLEQGREILMQKGLLEEAVCLFVFLYELFEGDVELRKVANEGS